MNEQNNKIKLFEEKQVRAVWDEEAEKWWFSIVDIIEILTEQPTHDGARKYWSVMKTRLKQEGAQLTTICSQLKMAAADGKMYLTDVADTEQVLRLVQSVPSKKAEPFNQKIKSKSNYKGRRLRPLPRSIKTGFAGFYSATFRLRSMHRPPCGERAPLWGAFAPQRPATI